MQLDIALYFGKIISEKLNLKSDAMNEIIDESNVPFCLKAGLIRKIYVGTSLMNVLGEIPLDY